MRAVIYARFSSENQRVNQRAIGTRDQRPIGTHTGGC